MINISLRLSLVDFHDNSRALLAAGAASKYLKMRLRILTHLN